jgi:hypothetical protein
MKRNTSYLNHAEMDYLDLNRFMKRISTSYLNQTEPDYLDSRKFMKRRSTVSPILGRQGWTTWSSDES